MRYIARLDLVFDEDTAKAASDAVGGGALGTVSGERIGRELMLLLAEDAAPTGVRALAFLKMDRALHPLLRADPELVASAQLGCLETGGRRELGGARGARRRRARRASADGSRRSASTGRPATRSCLASRGGPWLARELRVRERRDSELFALLHGEPPEALALALALGAIPEPILRFAHQLRSARPRIRRRRSHRGRGAWRAPRSARA